MNEVNQPDPPVQLERTNEMLKLKNKALMSCLLLMLLALPVCAQSVDDPDLEETILRPAFSGSAALVSKYIWRGQRLTNDWSLQPSGELGFGAFTFSLWGTLDLSAVNEGDALFIRENPAAPAGMNSGLKGHFSEVDFTMSVTKSVRAVDLEVGSITYTFPDRSASLPSTTEIYGGISLNEVPFSPSAVLHLDVDESLEAGSAGAYLLLSGSRFFTLPLGIFDGVDVSGSIGVVNGGFGNFYYGFDEGGFHDASLTFEVPFAIGDSRSLSVDLSFASLLGSFRDHQFRDPRHVYSGRAGSPSTYADSIWGGVRLDF